MVWVGVVVWVEKMRENGTNNLKIRCERGQSMKRRKNVLTAVDLEMWYETHLRYGDRGATWWYETPSWTRAMASAGSSESTMVAKQPTAPSRSPTA